MRNFVSRSLSALCLLLAVQVTASAQTAAGSINGVVTDPNGAVIQGASITAISKSTNQRRSVSSNGEGVYALSPLSVGEYEIKISAPGFKDLTFEQVILNVGQTLTLDGQLSVGGADIVLDSDAWSAPLIDTETAKVDGVIASKEIENLPLNGRNYLELALLTPGNAPAPNFDPTKSNTVLISSAGQLGRGANVMLDGTDNNDDMVGGSLINISQDAVRSFR
jgi:hypothetical protein